MEQQQQFLIQQSQNQNQNENLEFTNYTLDKLEEELLIDEQQLEQQGIIQFYIIDERRNDTYKIKLQQGKFTFFKYREQIGELDLDKLQEIMDKIDLDLESTETTHKFFSQQFIDLAIQGNKQNLKQIFWDFFNDELRRIRFFTIVGLPEPSDKLWLKFN